MTKISPREFWCFWVGTFIHLWEAEATPRIHEAICMQCDNMQYPKPTLKQTAELIEAFKNLIEGAVQKLEASEPVDHD